MTKCLNSLVERALADNVHVSKSEFIRCAVREKLTEMGFLIDLEATIPGEEISERE